MKSDYDIKTDIYKILLKSKLMEEVTGVLRKTKRPLNSDNEDVVISVLSNRTAQQQEAYVNVNVYVKDKDVQGQYEEDGARIGLLSQLSFSALSVNTQAYRLSISEDNGQQVIESEGGWHIINNKVLYQIINE